MSRPAGAGPVPTLPPLLVLTDRSQAGPHGLEAVVSAAVAGGARAVVLREKDLPRARRAVLAAALRPRVELLLVASDPGIAADGVHLAAGDPLPDVAPPVLGRSCHDEAEVARAVADGCTYVTASPVFASPSKPGYGPALGLGGLARLARVADGTGTAVFALGGVTAATAADCRSAGAHGVAAMGAVMAADDPSAVVADLLAAATGVAR